jgi:CheY-like chemotaxis protein
MGYMEVREREMICSKRILIIDDSTDMLSLLRCVLEARGYGIDCDSNGEDALDRLRSGDALPDLILLDLHMPIMDGYDFLKLQKLAPELKSIPTILMSGDENLESGHGDFCPDAVLRKPLSISLVVDAIERYTPLH